jgi:hypothetical protein
MDEVQNALKLRYSDIHPLIFQRSLEKSNSNGELFDILEGLPKKFPIIWDPSTCRWKHTEDLLQGYG